MAEPQHADGVTTGRGDPPMPAHIAAIVWARLEVLVDLANLGAERRALLARLDAIDLELAASGRGTTGGNHG